MRYIISLPEMFAIALIPLVNGIISKLRTGINITKENSNVSVEEVL